MRFFKITNGFTKMSDAYLLVRARFIHASMLDNPSFPTPNPTLAILLTAINDFAAVVQAAETGNRQDVATKNQLRDSLISQLHLLGNYVLYMAGNNEVVATSSGFTISKAAEPRPPITNPQGVLLKNGLNKGELEISCQGVAGAMSYMHEITKVPVTAESKWQTVPATQSKTVFANLLSGQEYAGRIAAIGPRKQIAYSDVVTRVVL